MSYIWNFFNTQPTTELNGMVKLDLLKADNRNLSNGRAFLPSS